MYFPVHTCNKLAFTNQNGVKTPKIGIFITSLMGKGLLIYEISEKNSQYYFKGNCYVSSG
jgi:hypothetical protein